LRQETGAATAIWLANGGWEGVAAAVAGGVAGG